MTKQRAVFIDRDGTLSEEVGYINHVSRFQLFPYAAEAIKELNQNDWLAIVITNQAGVARGYFSEDMVHAVHKKMAEDLAVSGAKLDAVYYCAHHPSVGQPPYRVDCDCRKPKPGLIERAARDLNIDVKSSWMVGDRYSDVQLAHNAGLKSMFVMSGYGRGEWEHQQQDWTLKPDMTAENILEAVRLIVEQNGAEATP